jgi:outer membrane protein OmpA-like peptidoglycan-associated protein
VGAPYRILLTLLLASAANAGLGAQYQIDDPVPPGAQGTVNALSGDVREIVGMASAVAGRVDPLAAALKDLGAKITDTEIRIEMSADVLFDFDKANLKQVAKPALANVATVLQGYPRATVEIEGHTDAKGSDAYNQNLSERRARAVQDWLKKREGLKAVTFSTRGLGAKQPVAPNTKPNGADDPEGRQKNRRVEIVVKKS